MTSSTSLNEAALAQECLQRLGDENGVLHQVEEVLELVAHSSVGLGEVLQDFAHQTLSQLRDLMTSIRNITGGVGTAEDRQMVSNAYFILNTARLVLDRTPVAMQRNMAETIGATKLSRADVQKAAHAFAQSPDIARLLVSEESARGLALLVDSGNGVIASGKTSIFLESASH